MSATLVKPNILVFKRAAPHLNINMKGHQWHTWGDCPTCSTDNEKEETKKVTYMPPVLKSTQDAWH